MKNLNIRISSILILALLISCTSCKKNDYDIDDFRSQYTGVFNGIKVNTSWIDTIVGYKRDTSLISIAISKSPMDSRIDVNLKPSNSSQLFSFEFINGAFISTSQQHRPIINLENDSLYFKYQAGLGPSWFECFAVKE